MAKKVTKAKLKQLQQSGVVITPKKVAAPKEEVVTKKINTEDSSAAMKIAVQAAETAVALAQNTQTLLKESTDNNRVLMTKMVEVIDSKNNVTGLKINRNKKELMTDIEIIRKTN